MQRLNINQQPAGLLLGGGGAEAKERKKKERDMVLRVCIYVCAHVRVRLCVLCIDVLLLAVKGTRCTVHMYKITCRSTLHVLNMFGLTNYMIICAQMY